MPITIEQLSDYMKAAELKFYIAQPCEEILIKFPSHRYESHLTGDKLISLVVRVFDNGEQVSIFAPQVFTLASATFEEAAIRSCLELGWQVRAVQCQLDPSDGEIRFETSLFVKDGTLTSAQFLDALHLLHHVIDEFTPTFREAAETGSINWGHFGRHDAELDNLELADMMDRIGGVEGLRSLMRESGFGESGTRENQKNKTDKGPK